MAVPQQDKPTVASSDCAISDMLLTYFRSRFLILLFGFTWLLLSPSLLAATCFQSVAK